MTSMANMKSIKSNKTEHIRTIFFFEIFLSMLRVYNSKQIYQNATWYRDVVASKRNVY